MTLDRVAKETTIQDGIAFRENWHNVRRDLESRPSRHAEPSGLVGA